MSFLSGGVVLDSEKKAVLVRLGPLTHSMGNPAAVWLRVGRDGAEMALRIEASDANRTVLEFRSARAPEMFGGIDPFPIPG